MQAPETTASTPVSLAPSSSSFSIDNLTAVVGGGDSKQHFFQPISFFDDPDGDDGLSSLLFDPGTIFLDSDSKRSGSEKKRITDP